jgi:pyrroline-5-carboxylate reductase
MKIAIIGTGNLGKSIANGLLEAKVVKPKDLTLTKRNYKALDNYKKQGVEITDNNKQAIKGKDIIWLCVQPHKLGDVLKDIGASLENQIVISTITGIKLKDFETKINKSVTLFRAMPNTAIAIKESMTCIATNNASKKEKEIVETLFSHLGTSLFIDDELMGSATVLAASGIAFALRYIRAAMQAGIEIGFESDEAQKIAAQTIKGATSLLLNNNSHPESEIDKVTTPLGITITGLNKMEQEGFSSALIHGIQASYNKINKLSD